MDTFKAFDSNTTESDPPVEFLTCEQLDLAKIETNDLSNDFNGFATTDNFVQESANKKKWLEGKKNGKIKCGETEEELINNQFDDNNSMSSDANQFNQNTCDLELQQRKNSNTPHLSIENEPFYFESDALALRNNSDYSCLLKTLILLEAQRIQACQDLELLISLKQTATQDPITFVDKIKRCNSQSNNSTTDCKPSLHFPSRQKLYVLPEIDWNKYYDCVDLQDLENIRNQKMNRAQSLRQTNKLMQQQTSTDSNNNNNTTNSPNPSDTKLTRGSLSRQASMKDLSEEQIDAQQSPSSQANYNKSWSVEEQRYLEELLIEFPPEDNEAGRWRKIATKLGTRTPLQVQSHCQKYFIKLAKAGLPIPGRMPNMKTYVTRKGTRGNRKSSLMLRAVACNSAGGGRGVAARANGGGSKRMVGRGTSLNEISSMWSSFNPPITMSDEMEVDGGLGGGHQLDLECEDTNSNFDDYDEDDNDEEEEVEGVEGGDDDASGNRHVRSDGFVNFNERNGVVYSSRINENACDQFLNTKHFQKNKLYNK